MRLLIVTLTAGLLAVPPRHARACSYSPCVYGSERIETIELITVSPVPRDGAFVFDTDKSTCLGELAPHLSISVTHAGVAVPGEVVRLNGLLSLLIWRPAALLVADATYDVEITVDNDALGPAVIELDTMCGPSRLLAAFELTTDDSLAATPPLPAPILGASSHILDTSLLGVACCPDVTPWFDDGGCFAEVLWDFDDPDGCGFVVGYTGLSIVGEAPLPPSLASQFVDQIVVDGDLVERQLSDGPIAAFRRTASCARLERIHLGTGEVVTSDEVCPTPELAAELGPRPLDPMLRCDDGRMCATDDYTWDHSTCVPFDPDAEPGPSDWPYDSVLYPSCPDASVPIDSGPTLDASSSSDEGTTDDKGPTVDASQAGCACDFGSRPVPTLSLICLALWWRRRPTASGQ